MGSAGRMKKFIYKMQSILDIKQKLEDQEKANYAIALAKLDEEQAKLASLKARRDMYEEKLRESVSKKLNLLEIRQNKDAIEALELFIRQQTIAVHKAEQNVEAALYRLRQSMVERKTQEKLKENAFEDYLIEMSAEERKEIDELVSFRYGIGKKAELVNGVSENA